MNAEKLPPQAPEGGLARRLLGRVHVTGVFWYRFHLWGVRVLPSWAIGFVISLFTAFFFVVLRKIRRAIANNLEAVLGQCGWLERQRRIYRTMSNLAWSLSERYERLGGRRQPIMNLVGREIWKSKLASPEGFLIVTAHIGNWETAMLNPESGTSKRVHVVREGEVDPEARELIRDLIERGAGDHVKVHFVDHQDVGLAAELLVDLRKGEVVAAQGDRPASGGRSLEVQMFGRDIELPVGPAALAQAAGVEIVPIFCFRAGRLETDVVVREPFRVRSEGDRRDAQREAVRRIASEIEWAIRQRPFQWFCFRDLWGTTEVELESPEEVRS